MINKEKISGIEYLSFEGGGGKGIVYLGAIRALEKKLEVQSIIDISQPLDERKIKGLSGASAGAITSFMIAMGMSADDIEEELRTETEKNYTVIDDTIYSDSNAKFNSFIVPRFNPRTFRNLPIGKLNLAETFLKGSDNTVRTVRKEGREHKYQIDFGLTWSSGMFAVSSLISKIITWFSNTITNQIILNLFFTKKPGELYAASETSRYLNNLVHHRGVFSGVPVRIFFKNLLQRRLLDQFNGNFPGTNEKLPPPEYITFYDFFRLTGVDLIITGTNVTQHRSLYFSAYHTPDFPVIEAVGVSMNLPIIFKPVFIEYKVNKQESNNYNNLYTGHFVDGGMLNNLPIHAFNVKKKKLIKFHDKIINYDLGANTYNASADFTQETLGFMLGDDRPNDKPMYVNFNQEFPTNNKSTDNTLSFIGDLFATFMFPGSGGRIRNPIESKYSLELNSESVSLVDFSHYDTQQKRGEYLLHYTNKQRSRLEKEAFNELRYFAIGEIQNALKKKERIREAEEKVDKLLKNIEFGD